MYYIIPYISTADALTENIKRMYFQVQLGLKNNTSPEKLDWKNIRFQISITISQQPTQEMFFANAKKAVGLLEKFIYTALKLVAYKAVSDLLVEINEESS